MAISRTNRTSTRGKDLQVIEGINKDLQTMSPLYLGGTTYTPTTLSALLQSRIDAANKVAIAKAAWLNAGTTYVALDQVCNQVVHDLKQLVIAAFGPTSLELADFGFAPRKKATLTPEQKVAAAEKRAATRAARHTLGPKAKLKVTGASAQAAAPPTHAQPPASAPAVVTEPAPAPAALASA